MAPLFSCFKTNKTFDDNGDQPPAYHNVVSAAASRQPARVARPSTEKAPLNNLIDASAFDPHLPMNLVEAIENEVEYISDILRETSLSMQANPELGWHEYKTHDLLTKTLDTIGCFDKVERHAYGLKTAFEATYEYGSGGPVVGFQSEMDALPGVGHACGHELIAISGIAASVAVAKTLKKQKIPGKVILLGTPAEETTGGKITLLNKGAYKPMDACVMLHPAPADGMTDMLAVSSVEVKYTGHGAHAAGAPWEGVNALDAAVNAYNAISSMRQQIRPEERVHGIIKSPPAQAFNIIPDEYSLAYGVRSPTKKQVNVLKKRIENIFNAAAQATGCKVEMKWIMNYADLRNNGVLSNQYVSYMESRQDIEFPTEKSSMGSTDFGDISYAVPSIHPHFRIPVGEGAGNHTPGFEKAAGEWEAHLATLKASKGIAQVALRVVTDNDFRKAAWQEFRSMEK